jgi:DNA repair exonuclease SbcCD ATPase subunit
MKINHSLKLTALLLLATNFFHINAATDPEDMAVGGKCSLPATTPQQPGVDLAQQLEDMRTQYRLEVYKNTELRRAAVEIEGENARIFREKNALEQSSQEALAKLVAEISAKRAEIKGLCAELETMGKMEASSKQEMDTLIARLSEIEARERASIEKLASLQLGIDATKEEVRAAIVQRTSVEEDAREQLVTTSSQRAIDTIKEELGAAIAQRASVEKDVSEQLVTATSAFKFISDIIGHVSQYAGIIDASLATGKITDEEKAKRLTDVNSKIFLHDAITIATLNTAKEAAEAEVKRLTEELAAVQAQMSSGLAERDTATSKLQKLAAAHKNYNATMAALFG